MLGVADKLPTSIQAMLTFLLDSARLALGLVAARKLITSSIHFNRLALDLASQQLLHLFHSNRLALVVGAVKYFIDSFN